MIFLSLLALPVEMTSAKKREAIAAQDNTSFKREEVFRPLLGNNFFHAYEQNVNIH